MLLIDTSVWISVFRDRTGQVRPKLETLINDREILLTRFTQPANTIRLNDAGGF